MLDQRLKCSEFFDVGHSINILPRIPQAPFPEHSHDFYELVLVTSGSAIHIQDGEATPISQGSILYINNLSTYHCFTNMDQLCLVNVLLEPELLQGQPLLQILSDSFSSKFSQLLLPPNILEKSEQILQQINYENHRSDPYSRTMIENLLTQLAITLWRTYRHPTQLYRQKNIRLLMILNELNENFRHKIEWPELCEKYKLPPRTLNRKMQDMVGLTPNNYLNRIRLCHASVLLKNTKKSITDIAFNCGFNDSNYFSNKFHQLFTLTPLQYRKKFSIV